MDFYIVLVSIFSYYLLSAPREHVANLTQFKLAGNRNRCVLSGYVL
jgi:hypothetical protein